ncbi:DUF6538 domain-containing protein [Octadecabacter antarcticus]|uniref:DUF6538 domain-containing protein n=1 Tax=Octadecabacter antarcticus TaxID=1217908 RepID=UPI0038CD1DEA
MASKISYLFRSPTGWFEYRRRIPKRLQPHFPNNRRGKLMTEWKQSLNTTNEAEALRKWVAENERYMAAQLTAEISLGGPQVIPPHRAVNRRVKWDLCRGVRRGHFG